VFGSDRPKESERVNARGRTAAPRPRNHGWRPAPTRLKLNKAASKSVPAEQVLPSRWEAGPRSHVRLERPRTATNEPGPVPGLADTPSASYRENSSETHQRNRNRASRGRFGC